MAAEGGKQNKKHGQMLFAMFLAAVVVVALIRMKTTTPQASNAVTPPVAGQGAAALQPSAPDKPSTSAEAQEDFRIPPFLENPEPGALAPILDPSLVPPHAQDGYIVARNHPTLLAQLPCFCYCDKFGHRSLHDCFESDHAAGCDICLKEALEAEQMNREGLSADEIRGVIIEKYRPPVTTH